jgi:hypothetical protein
MKVSISSRGLFPGGGRNIDLDPCPERLIGRAGVVFDGMDDPKIEPAQLQAETELYGELADRADDSALFVVALGSWVDASFQALALAGSA